MRVEARRATALALVVPVVLCLACCLGLLGFHYSASGVALPFGYSIEACVGVNTVPHLRIGVTWMASHLSSLPPVLLQNPACALLPWLPFLPLRGGFAFPP